MSERRVIGAVGNDAVDGHARRHTVLSWFGVVVFGRLYTVLMCDLPDQVLGIDTLCHTWINHIPTYLWVEILLYGPVVWFALHRVNADVFAGVPVGPGGLRRRRCELVGSVAAAMWLYGVGIHAADLVEVLSREREGIIAGPVYELAYFLDEGLSHYVQFVSLFFLIGWWVVFDGPGRTEGAGLALFFGAAHGVERSLGIIEGEKWFLAPVVVAWMVGAAAARLRRGGTGAIDEFFFRYAVAFTVTLPISHLVYFARFGGFPPASGLSDTSYVQVMGGACALTIVATCALVAGERVWRGRDQVEGRA